MYQANLKYFKGPVTVDKASYGNGRIALTVKSPTLGPIATASVNIPNADCPENCTFIKDYSENEGIKNFLIANKIIDAETVAIARTGFVVVTAHKVLI